MLDPQNGQWVAQNPFAKIHGFRISRLMTPNARWKTSAGDGILDKYKIYSEGLFFNEVLGLPYDSGSFVIKESDIYKCCTNDDFVDSKNVPCWLKGTKQVMVIDWAWNNIDGTNSYTIVTIATKYSDKIKIIYAKRFDEPRYHDPETVLKEIVQLAQAVSVIIIATDWGVVQKENQRLRKMVSAKIFEFMSTGTITKSKWNIDSNCYMIGRTPTMSSAFEKIRSGLFEFPKEDQFKTYAEDILNIYSQMDPTTKIPKYESTGSDDFFQTLNLILQVFEILNKY